LKAKILSFSLIFLFALTAHAQTIYHGMNTISGLTAEDVTELDDLLNPNVIRYSISAGGPADTMSVSEYMTWLNDELDNFDTTLLPALAEREIGVILAIHTPPGNFASREPPFPQFRIFTEAEFQTAFKDVWELLAQRYASNTTIKAFQLLNEPAIGESPAAGLKDWYDLQSEIVSIVRQNDSTHPVVVTAEYSSPSKLDKITVPTNVGEAWYAINFYEPINFLRQGVELPAYKTKYNTKKTKPKLKNKLKATRQFQLKNKAKIYVSEFTTSHYAPKDSGPKYLNDITKFFKKYKWNWTFHAWAEDSAWDVTIPALEDGESDAITKRAAILKKHFN